MKQKWLLAIALSVGLVLGTACSENNSTETDSDTINASLTDTVNVPTQGYNPDPGSLHIPDTMPVTDSTK